MTPLTTVTSTPQNIVQTVKVVRSAASATNMNIQTVTSTSTLPNLQSATPASLTPITPSAVTQPPDPAVVTSSPQEISSNINRVSSLSKPASAVTSTARPKKAAIAPVDVPNRGGLTPQQELLLANEPPGTIIKCITAQVIQSQQGPRIVLQGLQGSNFTAQQLQMIQHQVKQQLLKSMYYC